MKVYIDIKVYGKLPKYFEDFPIHNSSNKDYLEIRQKINDFIDSAEKEIPVTLTISKDDLNNLYTKGIQLSKFNLGTFRFYLILNDEIVERKVIIPWQNWIYGFESQVRNIKFTFDEYCWEESRVSELNGKVKNSEFRKLKIPLLGSDIIKYIFDDRISPQKTQPFLPTQRTYNALSKLIDLQVKDALIIFEV